MKRKSAIICLVVFIVMSMAQVGSAASFKVTETSPKDGATGLPIENLGVKVFFNEDVYNKDNEKSNEKACKIIDKNGKEIPIIVLFNEKDKHVALVLADASKKVKIDSKSKYTLIIGEEFKAADGTELGKELKTSFETLNPSTSMMYSMGMMGIMVVGMIIVTMRSNKKKSDEAGAGKAKVEEERFNPYKAAKEQGITVQEAIDKEEKRKTKEKKAKKKKDEDEDELLPGHYRVKAPRSAGDIGSTYVQELREEAKKKAEEKRAQKEAKKKNSKRKQMR